MACPSVRSRAVGLALGAVADAIFADPARWHPVAGFGSCAAALERRWYADRRSAGVAYAAVLVGGVVGVGVAAEATTRRRPVTHALATAVATWAVLGGASLAAHGETLAALLDVPPRSDLEAARALIPALCGRDPELLDAAGMARAGTESMAENTSDAAVAPLLWGAVAGIPGLLGYRAINTLDAMVGYRSPRYLRFGWAAARADDVVNLVPSRVPRCSRPGSPPRSAVHRVMPWPRGAVTRGHTRVPMRGPSRRLRRERSEWGSAARPPTRTASKTARGWARRRPRRSTWARGSALAGGGGGRDRARVRGRRRPGTPHRVGRAISRDHRDARTYDEENALTFPFPTACSTSASTQPVLPRHRHARRLAAADPDLGHDRRRAHRDQHGRRPAEGPQHRARSARRRDDHRPRRHRALLRCTRSVVATSTEGASASIDEISQKYLGRPYPNFRGGPDPRVILTIAVDSIAHAPRE